MKKISDKIVEDNEIDDLILENDEPEPEVKGNHISLANGNTVIEIHSNDENTDSLNSRAIQLFLFLTDDEYKKIIKKHFLKNLIKDLEVK